MASRSAAPGCLVLSLLLMIVQGLPLDVQYEMTLSNLTTEVWKQGVQETIDCTLSSDKSLSDVGFPVWSGPDGQQIASISIGQSRPDDASIYVVQGASGHNLLARLKIDDFSERMAGYYTCTSSLKQRSVYIGSLCRCKKPKRSSTWGIRVLASSTRNAGEKRRPGLMCEGSQIKISCRNPGTTSKGPTKVKARCNGTHWEIPRARLSCSLPQTFETL